MTGSVRGCTYVVKDVRQSEKFYKKLGKILGFKSASSEEASAEFMIGENVLVLVKATDLGQPDAQVVGGSSGMILEVKDLEATIRSLSQIGVKCSPIATTPEKGGKASRFFDPDGNSIALHEITKVKKMNVQLSELASGVTRSGRRPVASESTMCGW